MAVRSRVLLVLFAACPGLQSAWAADREVALSAAISFSADAAVDVSRIWLGIDRRQNIEAQCHLQTLIPEAIAAQAAHRDIKIRLTPPDESATGRVLTIVIEGVLGAAGGALTGTKSLILRGELRDDGALVGSFVARQQQTALTQNTCEALATCSKKLAGPIVKWLKSPVLKARLGSA
jgi:uncharacterized protein YcfJ